MTIPRLSDAPISIKLLVSSLLCVVGLTYLTLLAHIYIDTEMKPSMIEKAYGAMEYIELTDHVHMDLPYYAVFLFALPTILFMFTSYRENLKRLIAVAPFLVIVTDVSSMYLIPYLWKGFALVLWIAGTVLAITFLTLFILIMFDMWLRKGNA